MSIKIIWKKLKETFGNQINKKKKWKILKDLKKAKKAKIE